ncbi:MAG: hypothetical protein AUH68_04740 [Gemmatimonadetes bacterium 13_1_40CM_4_69_5]|nr:MAG: hypothetical protein AUH68_04740 [Gemmatimonadetes bacterium 13_1_40CM_4_69_5]
MKRLTAILCAALAAALACSKSSTAPDPDVIDGPEMAAVRTSLDSALKNDSNYAILRTIVFGLLDRASHITDADGETRIAGFQLDIDATKGTQPFVAQLSGVLAWRGYSPATHTVDSVTFVIGTGLNAPVSDTLQPSFSPANAGEGTGFIIHEAPDSTVTAWKARTGALHVTTTSYGSGDTHSANGLTITVYRGSLTGDYHIGGLSVPDSTTANRSTASFSTGVRAVKTRITGTIP